MQARIVKKTEEGAPQFFDNSRQGAPRGALAKAGMRLSHRLKTGAKNGRVLTLSIS
jgi:hypothetical protein